MTVTIRTKLDVYCFEKTHDSMGCNGKYCIIHRPIKPTEERYLIWRGDKAMFDEVCSCGIGHPAEEEYGRLSGTDLVHGCCGIAGHCRPWRKKLSIRQRYEMSDGDRVLIFRSSDQDWITYHPNGMWLGERFATFEEAKEYVCKAIKEA